MERGGNREGALTGCGLASSTPFGPARSSGRTPRVSPWSAAVAGVLSTVLCLVTLAICASGASAVIVHLKNGRTLSYQPLRGARASTPFDKFFSNLDYNGGRVMASNTNYAMYWDPAGGPAYPADYQPGVNGYFQDLSHDSSGGENVDSVSTQYNDAGGVFANYNSHFGGALIDTDPYPLNGCARAKICLTDAQLRAELTAFLTAHGLPRNLANEYFLLTPPGVEDCFEAAGLRCSAGSSKPIYCAYHSNIRVAGGEIIYANDPYVTGNVGCDDGNHPNASTSDGVLEGGLSHEHNESITDPEPNHAWTDIGGSSGEIGDKCSESMGASLGVAPNGAAYNQLINGHTYWYQEEWSNQGHQCLQRFTFSGSEPTAAFTREQGSGNEMRFDAAGSTAPGGVVQYNWQFNDGPGVSIPYESATPTVAHTFPSKGAYVVALTVFAADGTSIGAAHTVLVGKQPLPAITGVSPSRGPAAGGTVVTVSGKNLAAATAVLFGSSQARGFTVNSAEALTAESPSETAGIVDVTVVTPAGASARSRYDRFKFGPPTITALNPASGPRAGGTSVIVSGTGFGLGNATAFKFADVLATTVTCASITTCTVVSPPHAAATVEVRATVSKMTSPKDPPADRFAYR